MNQANEYSDRKTFKVGGVYRISQKLGSVYVNSIIQCEEIEELNVFAKHRVLQIIEDGEEHHEQGQLVRWRTDWYEYTEINPSKYPELFL